MMDEGEALDEARDMMNDLRGIVELARQVREAQKKYFKTRDRNDLVASKQIERRLDDALSGQR
jgi:exonuclease I